MNSVDCDGTECQIQRLYEQYGQTEKYMNLIVFELKIRMYKDFYYRSKTLFDCLFVVLKAGQ